MTQSRPYQDLPALYHHAQQHCQQCNERDYLMAFEAHPMIGDVSSLRKKFAATKQMASNEQQGASQANEQTLALLAQANQAYLTKHSFIFIICASGLSANTMLNALNLRLANATATEIELAALEQIKITLLRLKKGLQE
jgi:2-oxo-4-hydroxy-4-carboxy-5-ureidoimidazoline decarboxylase